MQRIYRKKETQRDELAIEILIRILLTRRFYVAVSRSAALHALKCHGTVVLAGVGRSAGPRPKRVTCPFALERVVVLVGGLNVFARARTYASLMAILLCIPEGLCIRLVLGNSVLAVLQRGFLIYSLTNLGLVNRFDMSFLFLITHLSHVVHTLCHVLLIEVDLGICVLELHNFIDISRVDDLGNLVSWVRFLRTFLQTADVNVDAFLHRVCCFKGMVSRIHKVGHGLISFR